MKDHHLDAACANLWVLDLFRFFHLDWRSIEFATNDSLSFPLCGLEHHLLGRSQLVYSLPSRRVMFEKEKITKPHPWEHRWLAVGWHEVRLLLAILWHQPIHQCAAHSTVSRTNEVASDLVVPFPKDLSYESHSHSRRCCKNVAQTFFLSQDTSFRRRNVGSGSPLRV